MSVFRLPVEFTWPGPGTPGANVWHVRTDVSSGGLQGEQLQAATDAIHGYYASLLGLFAPGTTFTLGQVVDMDTQEGAAPDWDSIGSSAPAGAAPPVLAIVVAWKTTLVARRGTGRTFLGPLAAGSMQADGTPDDTFLGNVRTRSAALRDASRGDNGYAVGVWGLVNKYTGTPPIPSNTPRVLRDIISYSVKDQFAVLRSRRD
jgi:hypothetical protein